MAPAEPGFGFKRLARLKVVATIMNELAYNKPLKRTPREPPELVLGLVPRGAAYLHR